MVVKDKKMIVVTVNTLEEREQTITKALADGEFPIVTTMAVLVCESKEVAIRSFHVFSQRAANYTENGNVVVCSLKDDKGRDCIGFNPGENTATFMYGIGGDELMAAQECDSTVTRLN